MKIDKTKWVISTLLCLAPILVGIYYYGDLPDMMVTHWGVNNEPNGWMPKAVAVFVLPAALAVLQIICLWATKFDKKTRQQPKIFTDIMIWICPVICILAYSVTIAYGLGHEVPVGEMLAPLLGVLFIVLGNYMPKLTMNSYMGIKLPWTYSSEENWNRTHRLGGKVWVICGFVFVIAAFGPWLWAIIGSIAVMILIPGIYSYVLYKKGI